MQFFQLRRAAGSHKIKMEAKRTVAVAETGSQHSSGSSHKCYYYRRHINIAPAAAPPQKPQLK